MLAISEEDTHPCIAHIEKTCQRVGCSFALQHGSLAQDAAAVIGASNLFLAVISTFASTLALLRDHVDCVFYPYFYLQDSMRSLEHIFSLYHGNFDEGYFNDLCADVLRPDSSAAVHVPLMEPVEDRRRYMTETSGLQGMRLVRCPGTNAIHDS